MYEMSACFKSQFRQLKSGLLLVLILLGNGVSSSSAQEKSTPIDSAQSVNQFSLDLHRRLAEQQDSSENLILSPWSLWLTLAMAREGAAGETREQLNQLLKLSSDQISGLMQRRQKGTTQEVVKYFFGARVVNNQRHGVKVTEVVSGSPAEKAGLGVRDLILEINKQPVNSEADYQNIFDTIVPEMECQFFDHSRGKLVSAKVTLQPLPSEENTQTLEIQNAIWLRDTFEPQQKFLTTVQTAYQAEVKAFGEDSAATVKAINDWAAEQLQEPISLVMEKQIRPETLAVLTNTVLFSGRWEKAFDPQQTSSQPFWTTPEEKILVPMMTGTISARYAEIPGWRVASLPFEGGQLSLQIFLPEKQARGKSAGPLPTLSEWDQAQNQWQKGLLNISLPKVRFSNRHDQLVGTLQSLGLTLPFDQGKANFQLISPKVPLKLDQVVQVASLEIQETGATAKAASAVTIVPRSQLSDDSVTFLVDRPYCCFLLEETTGLILFTATITHP